MARGGYGRGAGVPLRDRVRSGDTAAGPPGLPAYPGRHCWISVPVDGVQPRPALLLEWRRAERGRWEGRVVYVAELRPGAWATVEEWVPAELLAPSEARAAGQRPVGGPG
jgi:hypothetical protein